MSQDESKCIRKMVDLLRQGSTLTDLACPACASPLFRLRSGSLWCARCEKRVIVVKEGEEPPKVTSSVVLDKLEATVLVKVEEIQNRMEKENDAEELQKLGILLSGLLDNLEKVRKAKRA